MVNPVAMIIDDDRGLSEAFADALDIVGFETTIINDSREAVERIAAEQPALVTLDMQMPNLSGADVLRSIRADERLRRVKVILITASERASASEELIDLADIILIKPVTFSQISEMAARLVPNVSSR